MGEFKIIGGAHIGNTKATWPLATLEVTADMLSINMGFMGQVFFTAENITTIQPVSGTIYDGIKIIHTVDGYSKWVIFTTRTSYGDIMDNIKVTGFFNKETIHDQSTTYYVKKLQQQGRFPIKTLAIIFFAIGWNMPLLLDYFRGFNAFYFNIVISLSFAIVFILLLLFAAPFRSFVLKEDRKIEDLRRSLYFLLILASAMLIFSFTFDNLPPVHH